MESGILIVSFGTTYPKTRALNIEKLTECVREAYPDALVKEAVSSGIVRAVMKKEEHLFPLDPESALREMQAEGVTHVTVLPTHIIDGIENSKMKEAVENCRGLFEEIKVADVLLAKEEDYKIAARALWESVKDRAGNAPVIFMGHGTNHEADSSYQKMEAAIREYSGHGVYMATVEGSVTISDVLARLKRDYPVKQNSRVMVLPFMLVAGDHATNDMAGEEDSFASMLREEGYEPDCIIRGIGEYAAIREIYLSHLRRAIMQVENIPDSISPKGILYGIGVGPGDPELLTIKAIKAVKKADVLVLPAVSKEECYAYRILSSVVPEASEKEALCMAFPMIRDEAKLALAHSRIYEAIADYLSQGKKVAFLTIGDPTVYSTYMYMHHHAEAEGIPTEIISGIPSFCAAAARLGISLGEKKEEIHIIPASYDIEETLHYSGTRVYMKSGRKLAELVDLLEKYAAEGTVSGGSNAEQKDAGQRKTLVKQDKPRKEFEIYAVSNCGMEEEKVYIGLEQVREAEGYLTLVIVKEK